MLTKYGHVGIEWNGVEYRISPTFKNIAKLGSPTEIIDDFKAFVSSSDVWKYIIAISVLNACSDKELPESLIGKVVFSDRKNKFMYVQPSHGNDMLNDVIVLGEHCLLHGVCGDVKSDKKGSPLKEFDAYEFIEAARIHLGFSAEEAANMTMTEFCRMMQMKFPPEKNENQADEKTDADLLAWFEENNGVH